MITQLQDKVAVITGGASGIGMAMARRALDAGMKVVIADISQHSLDAAVLEFNAGDDLIAVRCDVSSFEENKALANTAEAAFGGVNLVCLNAGMGRPRTFSEISEQEWNLQIGVNLNGPFFGAQAFLPLLEKQDEAHIVITASIFSLMSAPMMAPYYATKAGVLGMAESLYFDLQIAESAVGVSVLMPGDTNTNAAKNAATDDMDKDMLAAAQAELESGTPPSEVAAAVLNAVQKGGFYILPNPGNYWDVIDARIERIRNGQQPEIDYETM